jgi:hypothetical protein
MLTTVNNGHPKRLKQGEVCKSKKGEIYMIYLDTKFMGLGDPRQSWCQFFGGGCLNRGTFSPLAIFRQVFYRKPVVTVLKYVKYKL